MKKRIGRIRILLFYLCLLPATLVFAILLNLARILPYRFRYFILKVWTGFFIWLAKILFGLRYEVKGHENIPPEPTIIYSNHQSSWETMFFLNVLPEQTWVIKKELLRIPFFGWGFAALKPIALDRTSALKSLKQFLTLGEKTLKVDKRSIVIFPQGSRTQSGQTRPYQKSAALLAKKTKTPILPIAHNAGTFWPKGYGAKKSGTIMVVIGPPLKPEDYKNIDELNAAASDWIEGQLKLFET